VSAVNFKPDYLVKFMLLALKSSPKAWWCSLYM